MKPSPVSHPCFSAVYDWLTDRPSVRRRLAPWRREVVSHAHGVVLEVGAGGGQSFPFYDPTIVSRVIAIEPDSAMRTMAQARIATALVDVELIAASVDDLPFRDESFDSVVASIVFCSVANPERALREVWRALRPGGDLLMLEHVRAESRPTARLQDALVPLTTRLGGNCHWNRDTAAAVVTAGFEIVTSHLVCGGLEPMIALARRPIAG